jgi:hypothetical protein
MANTAAAIRAAREVKADTAAPEFFREAQEWFFKANQEYRVKNFKKAKEAAHRARVAAEKAEFQAILGGAKRDSLQPEAPPPEQPPEAAAESGSAPEPQPTPAERATEPAG